MRERSRGRVTSGERDERLTVLSAKYISRFLRVFIQCVYLCLRTLAELSFLPPIACPITYEINILDLTQSVISIKA